MLTSSALIHCAEVCQFVVGIQITHGVVALSPPEALERLPVVVGGATPSTSLALAMADSTCCNLPLPSLECRLDD
jgi:hypothetical protein